MEGEKMYSITIIGLGPGNKDCLTLGTLEKIKSGKRVVLRTKKHPVVDYLDELKIPYESLDHIYDEMESFEAVYAKITDKLLDMSSEEDVIYAVPGNPFVAEETVRLLIQKAEAAGIPLEFVQAPSFLDAIFHALKIDPINGLKILDGLQLDKQIPDVDCPVIITQVYNRLIASQVKISLMNYYHDEQLIWVIRGAGISDLERIEEIRLYELDRINWIDHLTSIFIPKTKDEFVKSYSMNNLVQIMGKLRGKEGCPWDLKQTHESLKPYLIEEAYEVLEALDNQDMILLEEELGDLLLQIVFHAQLAFEAEQFKMSDVITGICKKLIFRHPHVFGDLKVNSAVDALESWEGMKQREKNEHTYTASLKRIPKHLPALMKSYKVQEKAARVGFDWDHIEGAIEKVKEELEEVLEVVHLDKPDEIMEEIGDLIFAVVNVARFLKIEPELALNKTIEKFIRRFEFMEMAAEENRKKMEEMSLEEMDDLWNLAKIHKNIKKYK